MKNNDSETIDEKATDSVEETTAEDKDSTDKGVFTAEIGAEEEGDQNDSSDSADDEPAKTDDITEDACDDTADAVDADTADADTDDADDTADADTADATTDDTTEAVIIAAATEESLVLKWLRNACRAIRWILPHSAFWFVLWLIVSLAVYVGIIGISGHIAEIFSNPELAEATSEGRLDFLSTIHYALVVVQFILVVLPLILATIRHTVLRAIEYLNNTPVFDRPLSQMRYALAFVIALGHSLLVYVLATLLFLLYDKALGPGSFGEHTLASFMQDYWAFLNNLTTLVFLPLCFALVIAALFAVWRVNVVVAANDAGEKMCAKKAAAAAMMVFVLAFCIFAYPASHIRRVQDVREQERMMEEQGALGEEFLFDENTFVLDEEFLESLDLDGDAIYLEDFFEMDDSEEILLELEPN
ncbi:MAG: hypothetical protein FWF11_03960 [Coriobacteriia bacterium]|nr:hypothetical protein [Coriobacteriia bacterium]